MSYFRLYLTFETNDIREYNNVIKNIIDNVKEPRKIKIEKTFIILKFIKDSWNSLFIVIN